MVSWYLFVESVWSADLTKGEVLERDSGPSPDTAAQQPSHLPYIFADLTVSFTVLVGIFFPSVTGTLITFLTHTHTNTHTHTHTHTHTSRHSHCLQPSAFLILLPSFFPISLLSFFLSLSHTLSFILSA